MYHKFGELGWENFSNIGTTGLVSYAYSERVYRDLSFFEIPLI